MSASTVHGNGDDATRRAVRDQLDRNIYIEAGAGTGKTRALVSRLTGLLASGRAHPDQVAAITFTRAAALEMRSRLRVELEQRARNETDDSLRSQVSNAADNLDSLAIQTIHAFALSLLRERPLEIGLPPVIEPMDPIQEALAFDDRWTEWFGAQMRQNRRLAESLEISEQLGLQAPTDRMKELAAGLTEKVHLLRQGEFTYDGPEPAAVPLGPFSRMLAMARSAVEGMAEQDDRLCTFLQDTLAPYLDSLEQLSPGENPVAMPGDLAAFPGAKTGKMGNKSNWSKHPRGATLLDELRVEIADLGAEVEKALEPVRRQTVAVLLEAASGFALDYAHARQRAGRLTFHDQLLLASKLLETSEPARAALASRYRYILIDEFQDTDPVQLNLVRLLGWQGGRPRDGALFLVGDPKQSIYRFRGADPVSAGKFAKEVGQSGETLQLRENHRSLPGILDFVNTVFGSWMAAQDEGRQAEYVGLLPGEKPVESVGEIEGPPVHWIGGKTGRNADDTRAEEFREVARLAAAAGSGAFRVRDTEGSGETWRDSTFGDVGILMRSRTGSEMLEDALIRQGVPYVMEAEAGLATSQDIRDLHACLTAIDDPSDQVAVVAALRSVAFSCTDVDLLEWKHQNGTFSYLDHGQPAAPVSVASAFEALAGFHDLSRRVETPELIERFVRERKLKEKADLARMGPERVRRIDLAIELASTLSSDRGGSSGVPLRDFTRWLTLQSDENAELPERVSQGMVDDAVRIMTIHRAKGLEFPVVLLLSPTDGGNIERVRIRTRSEEAPGSERVEVQLGRTTLKLETPGSREAAELDKADAELEDTRLLYVAATRARDHLLISRYRGNRSSRSLIAKLEKHAEGSEHLWQEWKGASAPTRPGTTRPVLEPDSASERHGWTMEHDAAIARASRRGYVTPTALKPDRDATGIAEPLPKTEAEGLDDERARRGRAATDIGRAVHALLQVVDLVRWSDEEVRRLAERMTIEHGIARRAGEVAALALAALGSPIMKKAGRAAARGQAWREVSVAVAVEDVAGELEGQIDLLFKDDDGSVVIVDHKTDRVAGRDIAASAEAYFVQMGAYAWAVKKATGSDVARAVLLFARRAEEGERAEFEVPDITGHARRAALLAARGLAVSEK